MWTDSPPRAGLPKALYADADVIEKAQAMLRAGGSDGFVSDYLGMKPVQVAEIRRGLLDTVRVQLPEPVAEQPGGVEDREVEARRRAATRGSTALLKAVRRYFARHHGCACRAPAAAQGQR